MQPVVPSSQATSRYDVIIVLGAAVWPNAQPSPALRRRMRHAIALYQGGQGQRLLVTGGLGVHSPTEAAVMQRLALEAGIPEPCIVLEDQATSTLSSALLCSRLCQQHGWHTALVVTDAYHLPRTLLAFWGMGLRASGSAVRGTSAPRKRWKVWYAWGREVIACGWYLIRLGVWRLRQGGHAPR